MKDKFVKTSPNELPKEDREVIPELNDAYDALLTLGLQTQDIQSVIGKIYKEDAGMGTEEIIKKVLAQLQ